MKKKSLGMLLLSVLTVVMLCACTHTTYTQEDIGQPKEPVTAETILGRWYFEGHGAAYIDFFEDGTYVTVNDEREDNGIYTLSDDFKTIHLKEKTSGIDDDVSVMYGNDILYFAWQNTREQMFTRVITDED